MNNFLVTILTSSDIEYLRRAVTSVNTQINVPTKMNIDILIIVNTLDKTYYKQVLEHFSEYNIICTESNGKPGKGHNSCLHIFKRLTKYDHLIFLDGDDLFYPVSLSRIYRYLEKYKCDSLLLLFNDFVQDIQPNHKYGRLEHIQYNFHLCSVDNTSTYNLELKYCNPFNKTICNSFTPGRLLCTNRNIFKTNAKYDENMSVYDDMILFCHLYEACMNKQLKVVGVLDSYCYLYNKLNPMSVSKCHTVSSLFKENANWEEVKKQFIHAKKWNYKDDLILGTIEKPLNYSLRDKKYYGHRYIVQFEIKKTKQSIIKIMNIIVKVKNKCTPKNWIVFSQEMSDNINKFYFLYGYNDRAFWSFVSEKLYKSECYDILAHTPILHFLTDTHPTFKHWHMLLVTKLHETHDSNFIDYCYSMLMKYKSEADNETLQQINYLYLRKSELLYRSDYDKIHEFMDNNKKTIVYFDPDKFNELRVDSRDLEDSFVNFIAGLSLCNELVNLRSNEYNVIRFFINGITPKIQIFNKILYCNPHSFNYLQSKFNIDYFIISEFLAIAVDVIDFSKIDNVILILKNQKINFFFGSSFNPIDLPFFGIHFLKNFEANLKAIICSSEWQKDKILDIVGRRANNSIMKVIPYGVHLDKIQLYMDNIRVNPWKFVSFSNPNNHVDNLISILSKLKLQAPLIVLHVYSITSSQLEPFRKKYPKTTYDWVKFEEIADKSKMYKELYSTEFVVYPIDKKCNENFPLHILDAMATNNVVLTYDHMNLKEICGDSAIIIPYSEHSHDVFINKLSEMMFTRKGKIMKKEYQRKAKMKVKEFDYKMSIVPKWLEMLNSMQVCGKVKIQLDEQ